MSFVFFTHILTSIAFSRGYKVYDDIIALMAKGKYTVYSYTLKVFVLISNMVNIDRDNLHKNKKLFRVLSNI